MDSRVVFALAFLLLAGLAMAKTDEYSENYSPEMTFEGLMNDEKSVEKKVETAPNDETPKMVAEDMNSETSELVQNDADSIKHKGFCHWGVAVWFKPGVSLRCSCMKCTCRNGGKWDCRYHFAFCPYYYCGNRIYNPLTQVCCCGKVYTKNSNYNCCGYFYYDRRNSKCCNYFSVKSKKVNCPRHKI